MTPKQMQKLHVALGYSFSSYVAEHAEWRLLDGLPQGALVVFQTHDPAFNAFELQGAVESRKTDDEPDRPVAPLK